MLSSFVKFAALLLKFVITWFWLSWSTCIITCSPGRHNLTDQIAQVTVCVVKSETFYVRVTKSSLLVICLAKPIIPFSRVRISSLFISYQILRYDFPPIFLILGLVCFKPELTSYFYITFPIIYE